MGIRIALATLGLASGTVCGSTLSLDFVTVLSGSETASVTGYAVGEGGQVAIGASEVYYRPAGVGASLQTLASNPGDYITLSGNGIVTYTNPDLTAVYQHVGPLDPGAAIHDGPPMQSVPFQTNAAGTVTFIAEGATALESRLRVYGQAYVDEQVNTYADPLVGTAPSFLNSLGDAYYIKDDSGTRSIQKHNGVAVLTPSNLNPTYIQGISDDRVLYLADGPSSGDPGLYVQDFISSTPVKLTNSQVASGMINDLGQVVAVDLTDESQADVLFWNGTTIEKLSDDFTLFDQDGQLFTLTTASLNNSGLVLLSGYETASFTSAVLLWNPVTGEVDTVAAQGSTIMLDGAPMTVNQISANDGFGSLYRDSLSDDGHIALFVTDENGDGRVILTQVPEPSMLGLLGVASLVLIPRRRNS
jgi:hypothetical protein